MIGAPQALSRRLPRRAPRRQWSSWLAQATSRRRRLRAERLEVIERMAREQRRARERGRYVAQPKYRVRPW